MGRTSEEARIAQLIQRLADAHPEVPQDQVAAAVHEALDSFGAASVRDYIPLLVERRARQLLGEQLPN
ncbi:three-helix bundle dimerization domain-containing protein [Mycolicibacterium vinylchloridicum]|uniref:three-helix bundle dimerization domain-containing protein n=1 Tax=Mycolicibacterium vinylchloridicum TaxID=2736928 RepID=UPI0015C6B277|nr:hypothetical protein [Mycolicibacterium vinylchloridicum]